MPILDASALDKDPDGTKRLREVLGPASGEARAAETMRKAAERSTRTAGVARKGREIAAAVRAASGTDSDLVRRYQPQW